MAKAVLFSLSTSDFELSFYGPIPTPRSFALKDFDGGIEQPSSTPKEAKKILFQVGNSSFPLVQIDHVSSKYNPSDLRIDIATAFTNSSSVTAFLPIFYENSEYQVHLTNRGGERFTLWHESSNIRSKIVPFDNKKAFAGSFNFRNHVGVTEFEIRSGERSHLRLRFTVFSIKIGFLEDRQVMLDELSNVHHALVLKLFNPTKSLGETRPERNLGLEWLTSFKELSSTVIKTIQRIENKAHNQIYSTEEILPVHKIKRPNKSFTRLLNTRGKTELLSKRNILIVRRKTGVNTPENRYIKFLMRQLTVAGKKWVRYVMTSQLESLVRIRENEGLIENIEANLKRIQLALRNEFWQAVGDELPTLNNKTGFLFHDLFVKFEKLFKTINRGLTAHLGGNRLMHTMSMDELYETWAYCKLAEVISGIVSGRISGVAPKTKVDTFQAILETGRKSSIKVSNEIFIGAQWLITTNPSANYFSPLVAQQPDLIFEVRNRNELNLLDAKYRINVTERSGRDSKPLTIADLISKDLSGVTLGYQPKDEDINSMHRYRDAIRKFVTSGASKSVTTATKIGIILYPHKPKASELRQIQDSLVTLEQLSIGAIPLSPGTTDNDWLTEYRNPATLLPADSATEQVRIFAKAIDTLIDAL